LEVARAEILGGQTAPRVKAGTWKRTGEKMKCKICGSDTSFERETEDQPPEGDVCSRCGRWVCVSCTDYVFMREINTVNPICKDCSEGMKKQETR